MNPTDTITLIAFLVALTQLDSPLPPEVQTQLKNVASVDDITANIGQPDGVTTPSAAMPDGKWNDLRSLKNALSLSISLT